MVQLYIIWFISHCNAAQAGLSLLSLSHFRGHIFRLPCIVIVDQDQPASFVSTVFLYSLVYIVVK